MSETWLKTNARAAAFGMILPGLFAGLLFALLWRLEIEAAWLKGVLWVGIAAAALVIVLLATMSRTPRLSYRDGNLLVHLRPSRPFQVPIEFVEAFFLGRGPSLLPGERNRAAPTMNLIIRLAEKASEYSHRDVKPALGAWCDGYITIRGTWCEPLNVDVANRLNRRLAEVKRQAAEQVQAS